MFRRRSAETRQPLMPGRKTRRRMFWAYGWRAFVLVMAWGFVWAAVWWACGFTLAGPDIAEEFLILGMNSNIGVLDHTPLPYALHFVEYIAYSEWGLRSWNPRVLIRTGTFLFSALGLAAIFAFFCRKRPKVRARLFISLLVLLFAHSVAYTLLERRQERARGWTPLLVATMRDDLPEMRRLLSEGANANTVDNSGWLTPLYLAARKGNMEMVELLMTNGAVIEPTGGMPALVGAVEGNHQELAEYFLELGADIHLGNVMVNPITAIDNADGELVQFLIDRGAHVNESGFSLTPLETALWGENEEAALILIENGANPASISIVSNQLQLMEGDEWEQGIAKTIADVSATLAAGGYTIDATSVQAATAVHSATPEAAQ